MFNVSYAQYRVEKLFTPHSPRAGFATEEYSRDCGVADIRQRGRWASEKSFNTYLDMVFASQVQAAFHLRGVGAAQPYSVEHFGDYFPPIFRFPPCWTLMASKSQHRPSFFLFQPPLLGAGNALPERTRQGPDSDEPCRVASGDLQAQAAPAAPSVALRAAWCAHV